MDMIDRQEHEISGMVATLAVVGVLGAAAIVIVLKVAWLGDEVRAVRRIVAQEKCR